MGGWVVKYPTDNKAISAKLSWSLDWGGRGGGASDIDNKSLVTGKDLGGVAGSRCLARWKRGFLDQNFLLIYFHFKA